MGVEYVIFCTTCGEIGRRGRSSVRTLRAELRTLGWSVSRSGGFDYCPVCWSGIR